MTTSLKLETVNIWGGRVYQPLMEHTQKQAQTVDIFCFQEVYSTQSSRTSTREITGLDSLHQPTNNYPARANIYQELKKGLPEFHGYYYSSQDHYDIYGPVDYPLSFGLAMFVKKTLRVETEGDLFVHRAKNSVVGTDNATIGRNLQYVQFHRNGKHILFTQKENHHEKSDCIRVRVIGRCRGKPRMDLSIRERRTGAV